MTMPIGVLEIEGDSHHFVTITRGSRTSSLAGAFVRTTEGSRSDQGGERGRAEPMLVLGNVQCASTLMRRAATYAAKAKRPGRVSARAQHCTLVCFSHKFARRQGGT
jgi:hypothetical protein